MAKFDVKDVVLEVWKPDAERQLSILLGFQVKFDTLQDFKAYLRDISTDRQKP